MRLTVPAVLVLGVVMVVLIRGNHLRLGAASVAIVFGFELAGTSAAPAVRAVCRSVAQLAALPG